MRLISVAAIFAAGAIVNRIALASAPARLSIDLAQPIPVVTWWGGTGALFIAILLLTMAAAAVPYALSLRTAIPCLRDILIAASLALITLLFWLPLFSSDVYAYAAYGEMARLGINPYAHVVLPQTNELFRDAMWQWTGTLPICVYGTLFVFLSTVIVTVTQHLGVLAQLQTFRVVACAAFLASIYLIARCGAPDDDQRGQRAALFLALNPVALWAAAEGHNDTLMLALVLAGAALYRRYPIIGTFVAVVAGTIKIPAVLAGSTLAINASIERRDWRSMMGAAFGIIVVLIASIPLIHGTTSDLVPHGHYAPLASVQSIHPAIAIFVGAVILWQVRNAVSPIDRFALTALAAWLLIPNPYPWYALWLLPLGAWATDRRIALTVILVSTLALLRYIPDAVAYPNEATTLALGIAALLGYTPLLGRGIIVRS